MEEVFQVDQQVLIPNLDGDGIAEKITVRIPVYLDPHTGEEMLTAEAVDILDTAKARHMGLLLPGQIREMRARLGLTQKQMSELLQSGEKSYTRWESGRARPSRMVNVLLRLLNEGEVSAEALRRQREADHGWNKVLAWDFASDESHAKVTFAHTQNGGHEGRRSSLLACQPGQRNASLAGKMIRPNFSEILTKQAA